MTLKVDTIETASGRPVSLTGQSAAKVWFNYDGETPAINDSLGLTSVTDNGVGNYTPNYSVTFADANYCSLSGQAQETGQSSTSVNFGTGSATGTPVPANTTTSMQITVVYTVQNYTLNDIEHIYVSVLGDLA